MKIFNILFALTLIFTAACSGNNSENKRSHDTENNHAHPHDDTAEGHGHSHDDGDNSHSHPHDAHHEQEAFTISGDSSNVVSDSTHHTHEDGSTHHNH